METHNSLYYFEKYLEEKRAVSACEKSIRELKKIRSAAADHMSDEILAVNRGLDALMEELYKSVCHDPVFTGKVNSLAMQKEQSTSWDRYLSGLIVELDEELHRLDVQKDQRTAAQDNYGRKCKEKLKEEGLPTWTYGF